MFRPSSWDVSHRSFILASDYTVGRGGTVPLDHVAPRCFTCAKTRPKYPAQFMGVGRGPGNAWRAVVLPSDPDHGQLRWITDSGAYMVVPICSKCVLLQTTPIDFAEWDRMLQSKREEFARGEPDDTVEVERTRKGFRG
jgi:hypothetical protein